MCACMFKRKSYAYESRSCVVHNRSRRYRGLGVHTAYAYIDIFRETVSCFGLDRERGQGMVLAVNHMVGDALVFVCAFISCVLFIFVVFLLGFDSEDCLLLLRFWI